MKSGIVGLHGVVLALAFATNAWADCSTRYFLYAEQSLDLADRVSVGRGSIASGNEAELGVDSKVQGDLVSPFVTLRVDALVNGSVYTDNIVDAQIGARILGDTLPIGLNQACDPPSIPTVTPGVGDLFVTGTEQLPPGVYGHVSVGVGGALIVSTGTYHFASIVFEPDSTLVGVWQGAPARLLVQEAVLFGDRHEQSIVRSTGVANTESVIEIHSMQTHQLRLGTDATIYSRIFAPFAEINVPSRTVVYAPLYGNQIRVEPDVIIGGEVASTEPNICL